MEEAIATLHGPAARLLLVILLARARGKTRMRAGEMKKLAGIGAWKYWEDAISQLEETGLATVRKVPRSHEYEFVTNLTVFNGSFRESDKSVDGSLSVFIDRCTTDARPAEHKHPAQLLPDIDGILGSIVPDMKSGSKVLDFEEPTQYLGQLIPNPEISGTFDTRKNQVQKAPENYLVSNVPEKVPTIRDECIEVDRLDDSGDLGRATSPAQARRRQQIAVVQRVWTEFFPAQQPLVAENAKWFLAHCAQSAEEVYDLLEYVRSRNIDSPLGYARKTAANRERERAEAPVHVTSAAFVPGPEPTFDPVEAERVDRAAHKARVANWRRYHPDGPIPEDI